MYIYVRLWRGGTCMTEWSSLFNLLIKKLSKEKSWQLTFKIYKSNFQTS